MMMKYSEAPPDPAQPKVEGNAIMHASLILDGDRLMAADAHPGMPFEPMKGITISLAYKTAQEGKKIFDALSAGGTVKVAYVKTFWADGFGMCVDRFGTPWMVNAGDAAGAQKS